MSNKEMEKRRCGVLIHPTSFPSPFGIGDFGAEAREILMMLAKAKVSLWQILPLGPTGFGDSPYAARSTFAGNELLIDLRSLDRMFGIGKTYQDPDNRTTGRVDYSWVYEHKMPLLKEAARLFIDGKSAKEDYKAFCAENAWWLDDYALYQALVNHFNDSRWFLWEDGLKTRKKTVLAKWRKTLSDQVEVYKVLQFFFFTQWNSLHEYANSLGIRIIGDIPIYVAGDSVDAWTNPRLFKIDEKGNQTAQAGCPPDAFTALGQLWGNPVYNWPVHKEDDYAWWRRRMEMTLKLVDIVRIDHFRGFESYWEV
ncbi:MAG: 4-alpha-glucanotransferase, partial [Spirochaetales bacterium]|nr:4-alpha-glucanotransferase [Spirochaetales bacterium]